MLQYESALVLLLILLRLSTPELTPPSLILAPSTRYIFSGERFSMRCPSSQTNAKGWKLRHYSPDCTQRRKAVQGDQCSPLECAVITNRTDACVFNATIGNSGLYWCEGPEGRSNSVRISASCEYCCLWIKWGKHTRDKL